MAEKFSVKTQSIRFRQRLSLWESWHRVAMTERARTLTLQQKSCLQQQTAQKHKRENEIDRKPGSVLNDDLSRPAIADRLVPPSGHASSAVRPI